MTAFDKSCYYLSYRCTEEIFPYDDLWEYAKKELDTLGGTRIRWFKSGKYPIIIEHMSFRFWGNTYLVMIDIIGWRNRHFLESSDVERLVNYCRDKNLVPCIYTIKPELGGGYQKMYSGWNLVHAVTGKLINPYTYGKIKKDWTLELGYTIRVFIIICLLGCFPSPNVSAEPSLSEDIEAESDAEILAYINCIDNAITTVDDGKSDPFIIARLAMPYCTQEFKNSYQYMLEGKSPEYKKEFERKTIKSQLLKTAIFVMDLRKFEK